MSGDPLILSVGVVDPLGISGRVAERSGETRTHVTWEELGAEAPGNGRTFRVLTSRADSTFRRLDRPTRAIVLAAEAAGIDRLLDSEEREGTGLVIETSMGCVEADLRYARALEDGIVQAAIFPYTLQSTCLGDVALRHALRGPTLSLSIDDGQRGEALWEARRMFAAGGLRYAVVGMVDALDERLPGADPVLRAVICVLAAAPASEPGLRGVASWPAGEADPFAHLAASARQP